MGAGDVLVFPERFRIMKGDLGAALVEFAIVAPVLMLIIVGGLDLGVAHPKSRMLFELSH